MEDSNTALLPHKSHDQEILSSSHSHHMYEKFIRFLKKKKKVENFYPQCYKSKFFRKKKIFKVQTEKKKIKYDSSKNQ